MTWRCGFCARETTITRRAVHSARREETVMDRRYRITDTSQIITPALLVFYEILERNIDEMVRIAGDPSRLRPHCKTHKMREVVRLELEKGITRHKAATFPEVEMLVEAGARDICLSYHLVGTSIGRAVKFVERYF